MTEQDVTWLLTNWQILFGALVTSCLLAFTLLVAVIVWTLVG